MMQEDPMSNVFLKNTTSSSITVEGHKMYYIDSTDAEIVEVEGTQPSFIDVWFYLSGIGSIETKTFAANDYWNSRVIDSTDEQTLRDFGVSLVDISGDSIIYGIDSSNSDFSFAPLGLYSGLRTGDLNADMSNFYVANGDGTWSNRKCIWSISAYSTPALTWKCHITKNGGDTSVKYNAFKYTLNGTPYWYVIDGEHDTWTDDLSAWGYSEVPVGPVLPTVNLLNYGWYNRGSSDTGAYIASGASFILNDTSGNPLPYDTSVIYGVYMYYPARIGDGTRWAGFSASNDSNQIKLTNTSDTGVTVQRVIYATCSDSTATVVTVYDSSNVAYNAFKFTADNTDYYYVLDGVQSDWADDLAGIGYQLYQEIIVYVPGGRDNVYYYQDSITSGYSGGPSISYLYACFSDANLSQSVPYDSTKRYERGYYSNGIWNPYPIQSVNDMPQSVVSTGGKTATIVYNDNGILKLWDITNLDNSSSPYSYISNPQPLTIRIYPL